MVGLSLQALINEQVIGLIGGAVLVAAIYLIRRRIKGFT